MSVPRWLARERRALERRLSELDKLAESSADAGYGDYMFHQFLDTTGLNPELGRIVLVTAVMLFIWTHGRAVARSVGVLLLSAVITVWAALRRAYLLVQPPRPELAAAASAASSNASTRFARRRPIKQLWQSQLVSTLREVWQMHADCLTLQAADLLAAVDASIASDPSSHYSKQANAELEAHASAAAAVRSRVVAATQALQLFEEDSGWSGSVEVLGSRTRFRHEGGGMTLRIDGQIDGVPLGDVLAVWREVGQFHEWLPSCTSSKLLRMVGVGDVLFHMHISVLGLFARDAVVHAYSVDALEEVRARARGRQPRLVRRARRLHAAAAPSPWPMPPAPWLRTGWLRACLAPHNFRSLPPSSTRQSNAIILIGKSVTQAEMPDDHIPPVGDTARLEYRKLQVLLEPLSETSTRASLMLSIDPKMRVLPMAFVEGILRRTVCMLFWLCRRAALKAGTGEGPHAAAIRADPAFYQDFLAPRICAHFERRAKAKAQVGVVNGSRPKW